MEYEFRVLDTQATVGFAACVPKGDVDLDAALAHLRACPMDDYMHVHALTLVQRLDDAALRNMLDLHGDDPLVSGLVRECVLGQPERARALGLDGPASEGELSASPLVELRAAARPGQDVHAAWGAIFRENKVAHAPMPTSAQAGLALPFSPEEIAAANEGFVSVTDIAAQRVKRARKGGGPSAEATAREAEGRLEAAGVAMSQQARHTDSLSPVGLVRQWKRRVTVRNGRLDYDLDGVFMSYGKGLTFDVAWASVVMEVVERYSSWVDVDGLALPDLAAGRDLVCARLSELRRDGRDALDPNALPVDAPYADEPLHWLPCDRPGGGTLLVPAQFVFLFCNLDEPSLFGGFGSTGLASGSTMAQARLGALLEVVERDAETVSTVAPERWFRIESRDRQVRELLENYRKRGLDVLFAECTSALGIPCYRAFATGPQGQVAKGASAGLCGAKAIVSAMLEVPYPFPFGPASLPGPAELPVVCIEDLPDHSTGSIEGDLRLVEQTLSASGREPLYADLMRRDLRYPVVRAIVPGLELLPDFDRSSRLSPRLFVGA